MDEEEVMQVHEEADSQPKTECEVDEGEEAAADADHAAAQPSLHPDPDRQSDDDFDPDTVVSEAAFWHVSSCPLCPLSPLRVLSCSS